jgi:hypothetical protein
MGLRNGNQMCQSVGSRIDQRYVHCHRNPMNYLDGVAVFARVLTNMRSAKCTLILAILITTSVQFALSSKAGEMPNEQVGIYLNLALSNSNKVLRKPANLSEFTFDILCTYSQDDKCKISLINEKFRGAFGGNSRFKLKNDRKNPDIKLVFLDSLQASTKKIELSELYSSGFTDSQDIDCQLYYYMRQNVIEKIVIVISLDSTELKQKFCLASQVTQGLGLSLLDGSPFSKGWKEHFSVQNSLNDETILKIIESYGIFSYIQLCPSLKPGMKSNGILPLLRKGSICLDGLYLKSPT